MAVFLPEERKSGSGDSFSLEADARRAYWREGAAGVVSPAFRTGNAAVGFMSKLNAFVNEHHAGANTAIISANEGKDRSAVAAMVGSGLLGTT